ncbi:hypothetical protein [Chitinophaga sp. CF418]|uniref:hypothetical protein n=1 Tax=Chitinophaga sp. CF418 TaxID=1855287 RepID=UPI00091831B3|nr:hypothetical protein [Chitinophaga sp. CF418]SHN45909.1 hypothetical protein SAMN05216311_12225 [Chitinophaga sp. CF418]
MGKGTQEKIISVRSFAVQIGVSEGAVRKAIKSWKFTVGVQEDGKINAVAAMDDAWVKKQLVVKAKAGVSRTKAIEKIDAKIKGKVFESADADEGEDMGEQGDDEIDLDEDIADSIKVTKSLKAAEAMRRREIVALALDKKKLQELEGILVRRDAVDKSLFLLGSQLKKAILDIPARCVRDIMSAETEVEGIKVLTDEIVLVLNTYANLKADIK